MNTYSQSYLAHHGIKGQKWGVRRFQNEDGTLTPLGRRKLKKISDASVGIDKIDYKLMKQHPEHILDTSRMSKADIKKHNKLFETCKNLTEELDSKGLTVTKGYEMKGKDLYSRVSVKYNNKPIDTVYKQIAKNYDL